VVGLGGSVGPTMIGVGCDNEDVDAEAGGKEGEMGEDAEDRDEIDEESEGVSARLEDPEEEEIEALTDPTSTLLLHNEPFFDPEDPIELTEAPSLAFRLAADLSLAIFACLSFSRLTSSRSTLL